MNTGQGTCLHHSLALYVHNLKGIFTLQLYFLPLFMCKYSECVSLCMSECCQNGGNLEAELCLNTSCVDTDEELKLQLMLC